MNLIENKINLFQVDNKYYLAHCIDKTASMGISPTTGKKYPYMMAYKINCKYNHKSKLQKILKEYNEHNFPRCILLDNVFHLITKSKHYLKPSYSTLRSSLEQMKCICIDKNIKYVAMPRIASCSDKLHWNKVREVIKSVFKNVDIEILICYL